MLASATDAVNTFCTWAHDEPTADFDAREERVLKVGRQLLATWLGQLASAAGPRSPACPKCGVHSLNAVRRRRTPRTMNSRCGKRAYSTRPPHVSRVWAQLAATPSHAGDRCSTAHQWRPPALGSTGWWSHDLRRGSAVARDVIRRLGRDGNTAHPRRSGRQ